MSASCGRCIRWSDSGKPDNGKPDSGKPGSGKPGSGKPATDKTAGGKPNGGDGGGAQSDKPGDLANAAAGAAGKGPGDGTSEADAADLEAKKKAANLMLNRLRDQMERGKVDSDLLNELGFTRDELRDFLDRLEERLTDVADDATPEATARRRQFESTLKGIDFNNTGTRREGTAGPKTGASGFGAVRRPAPPEYRAAEEAYKRKLSK